MSIPSFAMTKTKSLTILRYPLNTYVRGRPVQGTPTSVTIKANIQPVKPHELLILPEADRTRATLKLFSVSQMRTAQEGKHDADRFVYGGYTYEIKAVKEWSMGVLNHYWALAVRVANLEENDNANSLPPY